jgi:hypothetical protein
MSGDPTSLLTSLVHTLMRLENYPRAATVHKAFGDGRVALPVGTHQHLALRLAQRSTDATNAALIHSTKALELAPKEPSSHMAHGVALLVGTRGAHTVHALDPLHCVHPCPLFSL